MDANAADFEARLATLAELGVAVGVNLQRSQALVIRAPLEAKALVRHLTEHAYRRGASVVTCLYEDPAAFVARLEHADETALDCTASWLSDGVADALSAGAAHLDVLGPYPDLLQNVPLERTIRLHRSLAKASAKATAMLASGHTNASTLPFATAIWARTLGESGDSDAALSRLWRAIFAATRADSADPVSALNEHLRQLDRRGASLDARGLCALHCRDCETDLRIGLLTPVCWTGGTTRAANGVVHAPSIPVESVVAAADPRSAEGCLTLTRPLALPAGRVTGARLEFEGGRVVSVSAREGQRHLEQMLTSDDHAGRIGQIGLLAASAPLARHGDAFLNPMLDRTAGCHITLGRPDPACVAAETRSRANRSMLHIDAVFGGLNIDVDGIDPSGHVGRILSNGEFVI